MAGGKGKKKAMKQQKRRVKNSNCPSDKFALEKV